VGGGVSDGAKGGCNKENYYDVLDSVLKKNFKKDRDSDDPEKRAEKGNRKIRGESDSANIFKRNKEVGLGLRRTREHKKKKVLSGTVIGVEIWKKKKTVIYNRMTCGEKEIEGGER